MEFFANPNKNVEIQANGKTYMRHAIKTNYVKENDSYIEIFKEHVQPIYEEGDIVSCSEKIIALCQGRVIHKKDIKLSFWAKFLSKFVNQTPAGEAVGNPYKMQIAINICGLWKVLYAAFRAALGKVFKKKGVFYEIVGQEVAGVDGFCDDAYNDYLEMGILIPENPSKVCNDIKEKLGISVMIVDANDLGQEILGKSDDINLNDEELIALIKDNPAGQANQQTPIILIREKKED